MSGPWLLVVVVYGVCCLLGSQLHGPRLSGCDTRASVCSGQLLVVALKAIGHYKYVSISLCILRVRSASKPGWLLSCCILTAAVCRGEQGRGPQYSRLTNRWPVSGKNRSFAPRQEATPWGTTHCKRSGLPPRRRQSIVRRHDSLIADPTRKAFRCANCLIRVCLWLL